MDFDADFLEEFFGQGDRRENDKQKKLKSLPKILPKIHQNPMTFAGQSSGALGKVLAAHLDALA